MLSSTAMRKTRRTRAKDAKARSVAIDERLQEDGKASRRTVNFIVLGPLHDSYTLLERLKIANGEAAESDQLPQFWDARITAPSASDIADQLREEIRESKARSFCTTQPGTEAVSELSKIHKETGVLPDSESGETDLIAASYLLRSIVRNSSEACGEERQLRNSRRLALTKEPIQVIGNESVTYSFHIVGLLDLANPKVGGFFESQNVLMVVNLKNANCRDPKSGTTLLRRMIDIFSSLANNDRFWRLETVFLAFTHLEHIQEQLTTKSVREVLSDLFNDPCLNLETSYNVRGPPDQAPHIFVLKQILWRFSQLVAGTLGLQPISVPGTPDLAIDRLWWRQIQERILQNAIRVMYCFGTGP